MSYDMIHVSALTKSWGAHRVLAGIDLRVPTGAIAALLGPNGAGKTTLVRILATLTAPDSGSATIAGHDVVRNPARVRAAISLTGQYAAVDELLTGEENLRLMTRLWHIPAREARIRGDELLERFDLVEARKRPVREYSGGMRRKLDLALSLVARPAVLFLDEPTTGLDPRSRNAMWEIVRDLAGSGVTILLTTQYLEEADRLADSITMIDGGTVIAQGTAASLKRTVSGGHIELLFANEAMFQKAAWVLGPRATAHPLTPRTLTVAASGGTDDVRIVLNELGTANVVIERMDLLEPTLDDVFLKLTGSPAMVEEAA